MATSTGAAGATAIGRAVAVVTVALLSVVGAEASSAASAQVSGHGIRYVADAGEANVVRITFSVDGIRGVAVITDAGAVVRAGAGCERTADPGTVRCEADLTGFGWLYPLRFHLDDGRDDFSAAAQCRNYECSIEVRGGSGPDRVTGSESQDTLDGGGGRDVVAARGGEIGCSKFDCWADRLAGGPGADKLLGGDGSDALDGGPGGDVIRGGPGRDVVTYGTRRLPVRVTTNGRRDDGVRGERDFVASDVEGAFGGGGDDTLVFTYGKYGLHSGGDGDDLMRGRGELHGGDGDDVIIGSRRLDMISGGFGDDVLRGRGGNDFVGDDVGRDRIFGGSGRDELFAADSPYDGVGGDGEPDSVDGGSGRDRARIDHGIDRVTRIERVVGGVLAGRPAAYSPPSSTLTRRMQ